MERQIILGGVNYNVAPLKTLQVATFIDEVDAGKSGETTVRIYTRSLLTIARALANAASPLTAGKSEDEAIEAINSLAAFTEVDTAFAKIIEITGLKATKPGEAPAAESTSSESTAALSAS